MNKNYREGLTIVDTSGKVLREGKGGLIIVSDDAGKEMQPLLYISEVSDKSVFNIFMQIPTDAKLFKSEQGTGPGTQYEIMLGQNKADPHWLEKTH